MSRHLEEERIETYDEGNRDGELSVCPWPLGPSWRALKRRGCQVTAQSREEGLQTARSPMAERR